MADSVDILIVKRLIEICQPLLVEGKFRELKRASAPFVMAKIKPCIHLVIGDEHRIDEDVRGYTLEFPATFDLIVDDAHDPYGLADQSTQFLQQKVESDIQLHTPDGDGLCSGVVYDGKLPYTSELTKPVGGTLVMYLIQYRRERGKPEVGY